MKIQDPFFDREHAEIVTREAFPAFLEQLLEEEQAAEALLDHIDCPELVLERLDWKLFRFEGCKLQRLVAIGSYFADVTFRGCDLSGVNFSDCVFSKVRFESCRLSPLFAC